jgi:hypothetical protein
MKSLESAPAIVAEILAGIDEMAAVPAVVDQLIGAILVGGIEPPVIYLREYPCLCSRDCDSAGNIESI